jgi:hypothetical protein
MTIPARVVARARFINGIRDLANFVAARFGCPVPDKTEITVFANGADYAERCAQVDRLALALGSTTVESLGHYSTERAFDSVTYRVVAVDDPDPLGGIG